ncbi:MAG: hypothetical protein AB1333_00770 [Patescibacteria group bacterium]
MNVMLDKPTPLHLSRIDYPKKEHPEISGCCNQPTFTTIESIFLIDKDGVVRRLENKRKALICTKCGKKFPVYALKRKIATEG